MKKILSLISLVFILFSCSEDINDINTETAKLYYNVDNTTLSIIDFNKNVLYTYSPSNTHIKTDDIVTIIDEHGEEYCFDKNMKRFYLENNKIIINGKVYFFECENQYLLLYGEQLIKYTELNNSIDKLLSKCIKNFSDCEPQPVLN